MRVSTKRRQLLLGLAFASPWLLGFCLLIAGPILASAVYSLTDFNLFQEPNFVGLDNYREMLGDERFWTSLANTAYLTLIGVPLSLILSLACAMLLNLPLRGQPLFRAVVYLPTILPIVVTTYVWRWLMNAQYGYVNKAIGWLGVEGPAWLEDPTWTRPAILLMGIWGIGSSTVIYLAALRDVPREYYEAAEVDGAGWWARFRRITVPMLTPVTLFQLITGVIAYLQIFTQPFLIAQTRMNQASGGPGDSLLTYSMYLFQNAFVHLKMGYASAMAWVLFVGTMAITAVIILSSRRWVHYGLR
ncbi:carbohydrate ABC transporter permease [Nonomuraea sediminis]|uniref:carbohydrate ABC transporter permease n=1 Tax=Nonomuraea sediminis TaxID=2835864 RepID=UPI001BDC08B4|nr:sugar ABC transporter permease [Nonomuraea sediminis]